MLFDTLEFHMGALYFRYFYDVVYKHRLAIAGLQKVLFNYRK